MKQNIPLAPLAIIGALILCGVSAFKLVTPDRLGDPSAGAPRSEGHAEVAPHSLNVQAYAQNHVEAQVSEKGDLTLYFYSMKEKELEPIDTALTPEAEALVPGDEPLPVELSARPYPGEPKGKASRFVGKMPAPTGSMRPGLSLIILRDGRRYRVSWTPEQLVPGAMPAPEPPMPQAASSEEAKKLFLTPGGLYTDADIAANGRKTATERYGTQMSSHNAHPKAGDLLCPISETVANPKFSWVIGGKTYTFCCPPCIEEFVRKAKETPEKIKKPQEYVKG